MAKKSVETVVPAAAPATETTQTETIQTKTVQAAAEAAKQGFEQAVDVLSDKMTGAVAGIQKTQTEVKANMDKAMKAAEDLVTFGQGNVEAVIKSGQIWAAGVQDLSKTLAATAQAQFEQTVATWKALTGVKSLKEAMDLQASLARSSMETAMAESGKLTDASMKLAEQTFAPITARVTLAVEKFGRAA